MDGDEREEGATPADAEQPEEEATRKSRDAMSKISETDLLKRACNIIGRASRELDKLNTRVPASSLTGISYRLDIAVDYLVKNALVTKHASTMSKHMRQAADQHPAENSKIVTWVMHYRHQRPMHEAEHEEGTDDEGGAEDEDEAEPQPPVKAMSDGLPLVRKWWPGYCNDVWGE